MKDMYQQYSTHLPCYCKKKQTIKGREKCQFTINQIKIEQPN